MKSKGFFITFEGIDGAGKTTQIKSLANLFTELGREYIVTREPGGTELGEQIRDILKKYQLDPKNETLLLYANRLDHVEKLIKPSIKQGKIVISDRFDDSTVAYQHFGRGIPIEDIDKIRSFTIGTFEPDLTFFLDLDLEEKYDRMSSRKLDTIEKSGTEFFSRVVDGYRKMASNTPRIVRIDGSQRQEKVFEDIKSILLEKINL